MEVYKAPRRTVVLTSILVYPLLVAHVFVEWPRMALVELILNIRILSIISVKLFE